MSEEFSTMRPFVPTERDVIDCDTLQPSSIEATILNSHPTWLDDEMKRTLQSIEKKLGYVISLTRQYDAVSPIVAHTKSAAARQSGSSDMTTSHLVCHASSQDERCFPSLASAEPENSVNKTSKGGPTPTTPTTPYDLTPASPRAVHVIVEEQERRSEQDRFATMSEVRTSRRSTNFFPFSWMRTATTNPEGKAHGRMARLKTLADVFAFTTQGSQRRERDNKIKLIQEKIDIVKNPHGECAAAAWNFFENRYSSCGASFYAAFAPLLVLISVVIPFWQTIKECPEFLSPDSAGNAINVSFEVFFAIELVLRGFAAPDKCHFLCDPFNGIDALAVLPLILRVIDGFASTTILDSTDMMLPALRFLKLARRFEKFQVMVSAILIVLEALPVLLYTQLTLALFFSALIYYAEKDNVGTLSNSLWFVFVTMSTVGYGDISPETTWGTILSSGMIVISGLSVALPIAIVGDALCKAWSVRDRLLLMGRMREAFMHSGFTAKSMKEIVTLFDHDSDGVLSYDEFHEVLDTMRIHMSEERIHLLFAGLDRNNSGTVGVEELLNGLFPANLSDAIAATRASLAAVG